MRKVAAAAIALGLFAGGIAYAAPHTEPGVPLTPGCKGQTVAFLAQAGKNEGVKEAQGIGGLGKFLGLSNREIMAVVDEYCAGL